MGGSALSRRVSEFLGVALFAAALFWLIALATYDAADPVWFFNTGCQEPPANFAGRVGAFLAELSYQVLGFSAKEDWTGWDETTFQMPQAEMHDLIIELRSLSLGVGSFEFEFDHLQELTGRLADDVLAAFESPTNFTYPPSGNKLNFHRVP